jgi:hypothetical protein
MARRSPAASMEANSGTSSNGFPGIRKGWPGQSAAWPGARAFTSGVRCALPRPPEAFSYLRKERSCFQPILSVRKAGVYCAERTHRTCLVPNVFRFEQAEPFPGFAPKFQIRLERRSLMCRIWRTPCSFVDTSPITLISPGDQRA